MKIDKNLNNMWYNSSDGIKLIESVVAKTKKKPRFTDFDRINHYIFSMLIIITRT